MARSKKRVTQRKKKAKPSYSNAELTHIDQRGQARMVDVSVTVLRVTGWRRFGARSHNGIRTNFLSAIRSWGMVSAEERTTALS